jgi:hypothetical protein
MSSYPPHSGSWEFLRLVMGQRYGFGRRDKVPRRQREQAVPAWGTQQPVFVLGNNASMLWEAWTHRSRLDRHVELRSGSGEGW